MNRQILYDLYRLTKSWSTLNRLAHSLVRSIEVPLLILILRCAGARLAIPRNSIFDGKRFNVFMSDIDFSIVGGPESFAFIQSVSLGVRKVLPNLGELEFYTEQEWKELSAILSMPEHKFWERTYNLRKHNWQRLKLAEASSKYEEMKQKRSMAITLEKLGVEHGNLEGDKIFGDLPSAPPQNVGIPPYFSRFLEHQLSFDSAPNAIYFKNRELFDRLLAILPENEFYSTSAELRKIKWLIMKREYFQTVTSIRTRSFHNPQQNFMVERSWLETLEKRIGLVLENAPRGN